MKLIVGLGNPGEKYKQTRHNAGFLAIDFYLRDEQPLACESKFKAGICELHNQGGTKILFIKPQTFMNLSGSAVREICAFYKAAPKTDLLVVHDDKDLPFGTIRTTENSGGAGHNGVQSLIDQLGSQAFSRIRIGVEAREPDSLIPTDIFVLQNFTEIELAKLEKNIFPQISEHINRFVSA